MHLRQATVSDDKGQNYIRTHLVSKNRSEEAIIVVSVCLLFTLHSPSPRHITYSCIDIFLLSSHCDTEDPLLKAQLKHDQLQMRVSS